MHLSSIEFYFLSYFCLCSECYFTEIVILSELSHIHSSFNPWIIGGDFNCMYSSLHKLGGCALSINDIAPLNETIIKSNIFPLKSIRFGYTWSSKSHSCMPTMCKLDHAFVNSSVFNKWPRSFSHSSLLYL